VTSRCLIVALLLWTAVICDPAADQSTLSDSAESPRPSASPASRLAPFKERLAAAQSVKVDTKLLGLELDTPLEKAHEILDPLGNTVQPAGEGEENEKQQKVLWKLAKSDFSSILVKTDEKERITSMMGFLRAGKEIPFEQIGQTEKAPILTDHTVAWDIVRPDKSLLRVVARGEKRKANTITIFLVKRPPQP